jgi:hypothetical protein
MTLPPKPCKLIPEGQELYKQAIDMYDRRELRIAQRLNEIQSMQLNSKTPEDKSKLYDVIQRLIAELEVKQ